MDCEYKNKIKEADDEIEKIKLHMKSMLPKGYLYTYDIDINWNKPKKITIKDVSDKSITIREVLKKKPWKGYNDEHTYSLEEFSSLKIYKTEKEALADYKNNDYIHKLSREITRLNKYFNQNYGHYNVKEYKIPKEKDSSGRIILRLFNADIDREWFKEYKEKLHPNDDWTNVNLETYARWIHLFNRDEADELLDKALKDNVVGGLD